MMASHSTFSLPANAFKQWLMECIPPPPLLLLFRCC